MSKIAIIGSGFSGLSAAAYLSAAGNEVHVYEKNETPGGRARQLKTDNGYVFDMGPSWYWMPDVFDQFFNDFGFSASDLYEFKLLDPAFEIVFPHNESMSIPADYGQLKDLFECIEKGSAARLDLFMKDAQYKYETGMKNLVHMPGLSVMEFAEPDLIMGAFRLQLFSSFSKLVRKYFSHPKLLALMEFPVLFLGATPRDTPALYSLMNYAGLRLGTWYPQGGFGKVIESMMMVAQQNGASFHFNSPVDQIVINKGQASGLMINGRFIDCDAVIASADYHHVESQLIAAEYRNYDENYWRKKTFAPSCLIFYLGISKKIRSLNHHTLFFEENLDEHCKAIYKEVQWPQKPLFYVCCPSKSDGSIAPEGHENLFLLMPIAPGLPDNETLREKYFTIMMGRLQRKVGEDLLSFINYKKSYCINDFIKDYHSYKGNAYGLANTLMQTAIMKPGIRNKKVKNLFYTGQLTVPGPGVPPSIISGKIVAQQLIKSLKNKKHEAAL